ncbi:MAG: flagellar hook-length control protein FliK [Myxococcales bacterium]
MKVTERQDPQAARAGEPGKSFDELLSKQLGKADGKARCATANPTALGAGKRAAKAVQKGPAQPVAAGSQQGAPTARGVRAEANLTSRQQGERLETQRVATGQALSARTATRANETSERTDALLAQAHAASAETSRERVALRHEDGLRQDLLRELERQTAVKPQRKEPPARDSDRALERCGKRGEAEGPSPASAGQAPAAAETQPTAPTARAEEVAALVERIEAALKNGLPTLSLSLGAGAAAAIEIAKTAKGEVTIRITARGEARSKLLAQADDLKEALAARGLKVRSLDISQAGSKG